MASEIINNAVAGPESVPVAPGIGGVPAGLDPSSPDAQKALADYGRSAGYIGKSLATGMAQGTQAAQGATNPLSAFMQGMAAGLQAPAQVFQAKRNQIQSAFEATPFGVTHAQLIKDHPELSILAGMPTGLAMPAIATIAVQSAKVYEETEAKKKEYILQGSIERQNKLFEATLKGKDPTDFKGQIEIGKSFQGLDPVVKYNALLQPYQSIMSAEANAPLNADGTKNLAVADKQMMVGFMRIVAPQIRVTEGSSQLLDASSGLDKATVGWWNKVANGQTLQVEERRAIKAAAVGEFARVQKPYHETLTFWSSNLAKNGGDPEMLTATKEIKTVFDKAGVAHIGYVMPNGSFAEAQ